jgi:hypothetical protein
MWLRSYFKRKFASLSRVPAKLRPALPLNLNAATQPTSLSVALSISRKSPVDAAQMDAIHGMIFMQGLHRKMAPLGSRLKTLSGSPWRLHAR